MARKKKVQADAWSNVITRLGTAYDKRTLHSFASKVMTYEECEQLWRGSDLGARIIERPVDEMIRQGWDISVPNDKATQDAIAAQLEDLQVAERLREALYYARAYGGGAVLVGADDGALDLSKPLGRVRAIRYLTALTPREIVAADYYTDPREGRYGQPQTYQLVGDVVTGSTAIRVHESRLLVFPGNVTSRVMVRQNQGWGDSIFVRVADVLRDFDVVWDSAAVLMNDFSQAVFKIKGLAEIIGSDAEDSLVTRMRLIDMMRSTVRAVLIDADESFSREQTPMAGLPEVLEKFMFRLAAASEMPVSMLFGQAPAGLNATGDADIRFYYDHLKNRQDRTLRPPLERLIRMVMQADGGTEPEMWGVTFRPLWQLTDPEQANMHIAQANADQVYLNGGVLSPKEIRESRFGNGYSVQTVLIPGEEPEAKPTAPTGPPPATPTPPNGESPDGTPPLDTVVGAAGKQDAAEFPKTICVDFDGVLHSYTTPWQGSDTITDPPTDGAFDFVRSALDAGYHVVVQSARANSPKGKDAIEKWLLMHGADKKWFKNGLMRVTANKPGAEVYIDDRGFRFAGTWPTVAEIESMRPWNRPSQ